MQNYSSSYLENFLSHPTLNADRYSEILSDLQENIIRHHKKQYSKYIFLSFKKEKITEAKTKIAKFTEEMESAKSQLSKERINDTDKNVVRCFYLTSEGYRTLGLSHFMPLASKSYIEGMGEDVTVGFNKADREHISQEKKMHAMVLIASSNYENIKGENKDANSRHFWEDVADILVCEWGILDMDHARKNSKEWFGYREGISQPRFFPNEKYLTNNNGLNFGNGDPLNLVLVEDPGGVIVENGLNVSFGSYLVFMKFQQNQKSFFDLIEEVREKEEDKIDEKQLNGLVKAKIVGRFPNGKPLTLHSDGHIIKDNNDNLNDFDYSTILKHKGIELSDEEGIRCPLSAHIRKVNPRLPKEEYQYKKIVRRGVLYIEGKNSFEEFLTEDKAAIDNRKVKDETVGTLFMSFQRSIEEQFEVLVKEGIHSIYSPGKYGKVVSGQDALLKDRGQNSLVTLKWGAYFFAPSISFLRNIESQNQRVDRNLVSPSKNVSSAMAFEETPNRPFPEQFIADYNATGKLKIKIKFGDERDEIIQSILNEEEIG